MSFSYKENPQGGFIAEFKINYAAYAQIKTTEKFSAWQEKIIDSILRNQVIETLSSDDLNKNRDVINTAFQRYPHIQEIFPGFEIASFSKEANISSPKAEAIPSSPRPEAKDDSKIDHSKPKENGPKENGVFKFSFERRIDQDVLQKIIVEAIQEGYGYSKFVDSLDKNKKKGPVWRGGHIVDLNYIENPGNSNDVLRTPNQSAPRIRR